VQTVQLREGVTLRANRNPFNDLYHLELRFGVGTEHTRELELLGQYLTRIGSRRFPGEQLRRRLFELSTTLTVTAELDRFVVRLQGPQQHMEAALALVADLMAMPELERRPLRQIRRETWAFRRYERKNPPNVGKALRDHVLYGDNSQYQRKLGPRGARRTSARRLLAAWEEVQRYAVEIGYVGREPNQRRWPARCSVGCDSPRRRGPRCRTWCIRGSTAPETTIYFVPRRDAVQTQLWFAVEGDPVPAGELAAADAFSEYFGGSMAGLVFQEVREFRALAYAASARFARDEEPGQRGHLLGHVGCQADKTFDVLDVMVGLITKMPERGDRLELVRQHAAARPGDREPGVSRAAGQAARLAAARILRRTRAARCCRPTRRWTSRTSSRSIAATWPAARWRS
jgi:zinc protease